MPICGPCGGAADAAQAAGEIRVGHLPEICRDHGRTPEGCGCQHQPAKADVTTRNGDPE